MGGPAAAAAVTDSNPYGELLLLSGSGNPELSERIAREIGVKLAECEITRFADGEFDVKIRESVRGHDVKGEPRRVDRMFPGAEPVE